MNITLSQLRALAAVVDEGSFTDAAARLSMSQSAVSHAIAGLERAMGAPVLRRDGAVGLTALGQRIMPHARAALASIEALESAATLGSAPSGIVRLGAVPTVCQGLLPSLLTAWQQRLPGVRVQIYEGDDDEMPQWLEAGLVDVAILVEPTPSPARGKVVAIDEFCAVIRGDHPLAGMEAIPLTELLIDGLIVSSGGCEGHVTGMYERAGLTCSYTHRVREMSTLFLMVEQGHGVAIVPSLGRVMLPDALVMKPLAPRQPRRLVLSGPSGRPWHPLSQALADATDAEPKSDSRAAASSDWDPWMALGGVT